MWGGLNMRRGAESIRQSSAKKNGASKEDIAALLKEAEENEQRALKKWAAKIKAEAATKKATEHRH